MEEQQEILAKISGEPEAFNPELCRELVDICFRLREEHTMFPGGEEEAWGASGAMLLPLAATAAARLVQEFQIAPCAELIVDNDPEMTLDFAGPVRFEEMNRFLNFTRAFLHYHAAWVRIAKWQGRLHEDFET